MSATILQFPKSPAYVFVDAATEYPTVPLSVEPVAQAFATDLELCQERAAQLCADMRSFWMQRVADAEQAMWREVPGAQGEYDRAYARALAWADLCQERGV